MGHTYIENLTLVTEICCNCSTPFAILLNLQDRRRDDGEIFYCPNGHPQSYRESTVTKLERKLYRERQVLDQTKASLRETEKDLKAKKGQLTKLKNRVKNGVCPDCHRSFVNLKRHMDSKHK